MHKNSRIAMTTENPIRAAVAPLKADAQKRAAKVAKEYIEQMVKDMEAAGWDLQKAAPYPRAGMISGVEYNQQLTRHHLFQSLTQSIYKPSEEPSRHPGDPRPRKRNPKAEKHYIKDASELAALQYEEFILKLIGKVGECYGAQLEGNHVWGHSVLTVWKHGKDSERWKTKGIVNVSKLGKVFNQWPTRKVK
jgi:hypothetical protein